MSYFLQNVALKDRINSNSFNVLIQTISIEMLYFSNPMPPGKSARIVVRTFGSESGFAVKNYIVLGKSNDSFEPKLA